MSGGKAIAVVSAVLACAAVVGTAVAAPASGGRHLPYFSLMSERVAIRKLPLELRLSFGWFPGKKRDPRWMKHGPVWFGEVERPEARIVAAGNARWVCETEVPKDEMLGGDGGCTTLAASRELFNLDVSSCGKGRPRRFRIAGLVPNGVTGLEIEKADGTIGRTVPVTLNTVAFTVGREDVTLRGVGDRAAEGLERRLPLAELSKLGGGGDCGSYIVAEARGS
ncbi:MAG TPA: hypothetical protein VHA80_12085 [Solirubrobacterales bacterium]|jgi:hypothetical protein|nr:hypothetical protein [Solirubrobacterales bacterium]